MQSIHLPTRITLQTKMQNTISWMSTNWMSLLCCSLLLYLLTVKDVTLQISFAKPILTTITPTPPPHEPTMLQTTLPIAKKALTAEQQKQMIYVRRFAKVAQTEMQQYGIPASIKLAQGLLESKSGTSPLATKNNNHFGIKCFSKSCTKGHCRNFSDDSHKDFFRIYPTAWESYRAHSLFLQGKRYQHLQTTSNYKEWAYGLQKAGYATDKQYAQKLIRLIEGLGLERYDVR